MAYPRLSGGEFAVVCLTALLLMISASDPSLARSVRGRHPVLIPTASEKDAAIVVDGATGRVLYARNADAIRRPASLTKMMTLYLLFGALKEGTLTLNSKMTTSVHASLQEPTKLGLKPGEELEVETAIKAITVLSANDAAVVIAETLGGTENHFGEMMTAKAHQLGMTHSNFHNASGLPDPLQLTSARDMALLGRHLAYDFPQYYGYFSTPSFSFDGRYYDTHDHLLDEFPGVDGIKTGYTRASGFNLVSSVVRNNKHIVGVVMGGMSFVSRDQEMMRLLSAAFDFAEQNPTAIADANVPWHGGKGPSADPFNTTTNGTNVLLASLDQDKARSAKSEAPTVVAALPVAAPKPAVQPTVAAAAQAAPTVAQLAVKLPKAKPALQLASLVMPSAKPTGPTPAPKQSSPALSPMLVAAAKPEPPVPAPRPPMAKRLIPYALPRDSGSSPSGIQLAALTPPSGRSSQSGRVIQGDITGLSLVLNALKHSDPPPTEKHWSVQIGAFANEPLAKAQLAAYARTDAINEAELFVTPFSSFDGRKLYRARFGLFDEEAARDLCKQMTRKGQTCFVTANAN